MRHQNIDRFENKCKTIKTISTPLNDVWRKLRVFIYLHWWRKPRVRKYKQNTCSWLILHLNISPQISLRSIELVLKVVYFLWTRCETRIICYSVVNKMQITSTAHRMANTNNEICLERCFFSTENTFIWFMLTIRTDHVYCICER